MNLLRAFIVGSSLPVVISFLIPAGLNKRKKYSYEVYSIIAPTFFGLISVLLAYTYKQPVLRNYILTGFCTSLFIFIFNYSFKIYPIPNLIGWLLYYLRLVIGHITSLAIIYYLMIYV